LFREARQLIIHWLYSIDAHSVHTPFLFNFYIHVFDRDIVLAEDQKIENLRKEFLQDHRIILLEDFGTGVSVNRRKVSDVASRSLTPVHYSRLLRNISMHMEAKKVIELGTCLGINTLYLASAPSKPHVKSFEGDKNLMEMAEHNAKRLELADHVDFIAGNINDTLERNVNEAWDLAYIDANHTREATLAYFRTLLHHAHDHSIFIFDDIFWSSGMQQAWNEIKIHPRVTLTLDLFRAGIVFVNPVLQKEHWKIWYHPIS
jgi:predicted O-methyltransferase YrrM